VLHRPLKFVFIFLGAFTKVQKATANTVMSVCMEQLGPHWTTFHDILIFEKFLKICQKTVEKDEV
jgi:hypothetical protein